MCAGSSRPLWRSQRFFGLFEPKVRAGSIRCADARFPSALHIALSSVIPEIFRISIKPFSVFFFVEFLEKVLCVAVCACLGVPQHDCADCNESEDDPRTLPVFPVEFFFGWWERIHTPVENRDVTKDGMDDTRASNRLKYCSDSPTRLRG